ncbi:MAG: hypothetical protein K8I00_04100, partial [Candidatus Omnitrophica bacterium]|nr:hypothetical protein [Candidatus Omnitrophota bacterium]
MMLTHKILAVDQLSANVIEQMMALMDCYYGNVRRDIFMRDLALKQGVLLVYNQTQKLCGFTTYAFFTTEFRGRTVAVLYSGDTVIEARHWGSLGTTRLFVALLTDCLQRTEHDLYWFLLSKGTRTYQLLPLYFQEFYPHYEGATPENEQALIDYLAELQFGEHYKQETGIVRFGVDGD